MAGLRYERAAIHTTNGRCPNCGKNLLAEVHEEPPEAQEYPTREPLATQIRTGQFVTVKGLAWRCSGCRRMLFEDDATGHLHLAVGVRV